MKCTKCGFTSFDFLESCKKCGHELRDLRSQLQIIAVSPEEKAPTVSPGAASAQSRSAHADAPEMQFNRAPAAEPPPPQEPSATDREAEGLFEGLDFDESFGDIVEHTSYEDQESSDKGGGKGEGAEGQEKDDEELLDLDFDDLFGESK